MRLRLQRLQRLQRIYARFCLPPPQEHEGEDSFSVRAGIMRCARQSPWSTRMMWYSANRRGRGFTLQASLKMSAAAGTRGPLEDNTLREYQLAHKQHNNPYEQLGTAS